MTRLALNRAGARALRITPRKPQTINAVDGLVIGGGSDIEPSHYGETPFADMKENRRQGSPILDLLISFVLFLLRILFAVKFRQGYDPDRDVLEKRLIAEAMDREIPVLGICRGAQLLNVVLGGSLHQNIAEFYDEVPHVRSLLPRKRIVLAEGSCLSRILGRFDCRVNALHNQAIADLGRRVDIVARDEAQVVQAIEYRTGPGSESALAIGVQWHPEYLPQIREQQQLFAYLVGQARAAAYMRKGA
ncbi:gamma-glutamyl-gamma-aminobutyrate hydrolase family protein [Gilvimarinus sp. F26214L]|uniref:gamma-glutamyl-gamma-aminobutyrate hydrolase family protein n=1 Tax=Gilvimarinus sp. DZF01 TaxID=3461371 RepID=UPI004045FC85